jgi:ATP-binding cassette subfamily C protein
MSWKVILALGLMVGVGLTEGMGLLLLLPMLRSVGVDTHQGAVGQLTGVISGLFTSIGIQPTLLPVLGTYALIIGVHAFLQRWQTINNFLLVHTFVVFLRQRLYQAIARTNWLFFSRSRSSDFMHALIDELNRVGIGTYHLLSLAANACVTAVYLILALQVSRTMTGLVFACGVGLLLLMKRKLDAARQAGEGLSVATNQMYATVTEHLSGMKIVKSYGAEDRNSALFSTFVERISDTRMAAIRTQAETHCWFEIGAVLALNALLYIAVEGLAIPAAGTLLLLFLFARMMPRFSQLQQSHQDYSNMLPAFASVERLQGRCDAAVEMKPNQVESVTLRHSFRLVDVSFSYELQTQIPTIQHLDLLIQAGKTTAIIGPSGAGKSTIADLVMGLLSPQQGSILIDEQPLNADRMRAWREQIGYVPQETFLFHDSVRTNLLWAAPGVTETEIRDALRLAAAEEFVDALPNGLDTVLGDRGSRLSGGERQRLALTRALLRRPSLLILDEATSALDSENERYIQQAIAQLHGQMTILLISHRLSTIQTSDRIYVLEHGHVVEAGDWGELIARENGRLSTWSGIATREEMSAE